MTNNSSKSSKQKLSLRPPNITNDEKSIEEFINKAGDSKPKQEEESSEKVWENKETSTNQMKSLRLGIHEEYLLKLKYLSEKSNIPQQKIARAILYPTIDQYLEQLESEGFLKL
jgi:hypothetical protein